MRRTLDHLLFGTHDQRQDFGWLLRRQSSVVMTLAMTTLATAACLVAAPVMPLLPVAGAIALGLGTIVAGWTYADHLKSRMADVRAQQRAREKAAAPRYLPQGITAAGLGLQKTFAMAQDATPSLRVTIGAAAPAPKTGR